MMDVDKSDTVGTLAFSLMTEVADSISLGDVSPTLLCAEMLARIETYDATLASYTSDLEHILDAAIEGLHVGANDFPRVLIGLHRERWWPIEFATHQEGEAE